MKPKVLIVDDYESCRDLYSAVMRANGFEVVTASTAAEADQRTHEESPNLVIMDVNLPDTDGLLAACRLRSAADTWKIPILAISGMAVESLQEDAISHGCISFLQKPFPLSVLVRRAREILEGVARPATRE